MKYFFSSKISGFKLNIMLNLPVLSNTYSIISDSFSLKMFDVFLQRANCEVNPLTPKISLVILLTICHTVLMTFVWRIWRWINSFSLNLYFSLFSSLVCLILYWYCQEKFYLGHLWELNWQIKWVCQIIRFKS